MPNQKVLIPTGFEPVSLSLLCQVNLDFARAKFFRVVFPKEISLTKPNSAVPATRLFKP